MDIRLAQGSSGIGAAREIYAQLSLRCVFLSGNLDEATRLQLLPYEPIDFVGKCCRSCCDGRWKRLKI